MILFVQHTDSKGVPLDYATSKHRHAGVITLTPFNPPWIDGNDIVSADPISASFSNGTASFSQSVAAAYNASIVSDFGETTFKVDLTTATGSGPFNLKDYKVSKFQSIASASYARRADTASFALNASSGGQSLVTGSTVPITASYALIALSGATGSAGSLTTGSTYPVTSSWAVRSKNSDTASVMFAIDSFYPDTWSFDGIRWNNPTRFPGIPIAQFIGGPNPGLTLNLETLMYATDTSAVPLLSLNDDPANTNSYNLVEIYSGSHVLKLSIDRNGLINGTASYATKAKNADSAALATGVSIGISLNEANVVDDLNFTGTGDTFSIRNNNNDGVDLVGTGGTVTIDANGLIHGTATSAQTATTATSATSAVSASYLSGSATASLFGTASWARNTLNPALVTGSTYPITASWANNAVNAVTASAFLIGGSLKNVGTDITGAGNITSTATIQGQTLTATGLAQSKAVLVAADTNGTLYPVVTGSTLPFTCSVALVSLAGATGSASGLVTASTYPITSSWAVTASWAQNGMTTASTYPITASTVLNAQTYYTLTTSSNNAFTASFGVPYQKVTLTRGGINYTITSSNHPSSGQGADTLIHIVTSGGSSSGSGITLPAAWDNGQAGAVTFITGSPGHAYLWLYAEDTNFVSTAWRF